MKWSVLHPKNIQTLVGGGQEAVRKDKDFFPPHFTCCYLHPTEPSQPRHHWPAEARCSLRESLPRALCSAHLLLCGSVSKSQFSAPPEQFIQKKNQPALESCSDMSITLRPPKTELELTLSSTDFSIVFLPHHTLNSESNILAIFSPKSHV